MANYAHHPKEFTDLKNSCLTQGEGVVIVDGVQLFFLIFAMGL